MSSEKRGKMADENEDQWLYGDSTDGKEYTPTSVQPESQENDSIPATIQEKSEILEDQKTENVIDPPTEVRFS